MSDIIQITIDIRPAHNISPGALFNRVQFLLEANDEFDIIGGSARALHTGTLHPHDTCDTVPNWPRCALCGMDSNFSLNGVIQTLCYDHHPSGRSSTPLNIPATLTTIADLGGRRG